MEQLKEIAAEYKNLFMTGNTRGNPYYFMMYKSIEKLIKDIENETIKEAEENKDLSL